MSDFAAVLQCLTGGEAAAYCIGPSAQGHRARDMTFAQGISRLATLPGPALTGSNLYDAIVLSIGLAGILALTPIVLTSYRAEFPSFIIQTVLIVAFYLYVRTFRLLVHYKEWTQRLLLLISFTVPLEQTFFPHALAKLLWLIDPHLGLQLLRASNVLLLTVTVLALRGYGLSRALRSIPFLIKASFAIGVAGFVLATVFSAYPLHSVAGGLLEFFPVYLVIFAVAAIAPDVRFVGHACSLFMLACLGVAATQIIALAPTLCCDHAFYLRATVPEFVAIRDQYDQMRAAEINSYGNRLHYASLVVLLIPFIVGYIYSHYGSKRAVFALLIFLYSFMLLYSRSGMVIIFAGLVFAFSFLIWKYRILSPILLGIITIIAAAHSSRETFDYHVRGVSMLAERAVISIAGRKKSRQPPQAHHQLQKLLRSRRMPQLQAALLPPTIVSRLACCPPSNGPKPGISDWILRGRIGSREWATRSIDWWNRHILLRTACFLTAARRAGGSAAMIGCPHGALLRVSGAQQGITSDSSDSRTSQYRGRLHLGARRHQPSWQWPRGLDPGAGLAHCLTGRLGARILPVRRLGNMTAFPEMQAKNRRHMPAEVTQFRPGQSGNPAGRPKGSRNKTTIAIEVLINGAAPDIANKAIELARAGDTSMIRALLDRVAPQRRDRHISY